MESYAFLLTILSILINRVESLSGTGSHWSLLLYIRDANSFVLIDSSYSSYSKNALEIIKIFAKLGLMKDFKTEVYAHSSKQENSYDCGVYVVHNIKLISIWMKAHDKLDLTCISSITPQEITLARSEIIAFINSNKKK